MKMLRKEYMLLLSEQSAKSAAAELGMHVQVILL